MVKLHFVQDTGDSLLHLPSPGVPRIGETVSWVKPKKRYRVLDVEWDYSLSHFDPEITVTVQQVE